MQMKNHVKVEQFSWKRNFWFLLLDCPWKPMIRHKWRFLSDLQFFILYNFARWCTAVCIWIFLIGKKVSAFLRIRFDVYCTCFMWDDGLAIGLFDGTPACTLSYTYWHPWLKNKQRERERERERERGKEREKEVASGMCGTNSCQKC